MFKKSHSYLFLNVITTALLLNCSPSFAVAKRIDTYHNTPTIPHCVDCDLFVPTYFATLSGGPIWSRSNRNLTYLLQPDVRKTYYADRSMKSFGTAELFLGMQRVFEAGFDGQAGFALALARNNVWGDIWEEALPVFDDFNYKYTINRVRFAIKGKIRAEVSNGLWGYLSTSGGVAVNRSGNFTITPTIPEAVAAPAFRSNTQIGLSYTAGLGLEYSFCRNWRAGLGYEFADWGPSSLSRAPGQSLNTGLSLSHWFSHALQLSVTFIK